MLIHIPARETYVVESGTYCATCSDVKLFDKPTRNGTKKQLRIIWDVHVPGNVDNILYRAGKNYEPSLDRNSLLHADLTSWLGREITGYKFDTESLKGMKAKITIEAIENERWDKPYCHVAKVEPPESDHAPKTIFPPTVVVGG